MIPVNGPIDLAEHDDRLLVSCGGHELDMPAFVEPAVRALTGPEATEGIRVEALESFLDRSSALVLVRRLVEEGFLRVRAS